LPKLRGIQITRETNWLVGWLVISPGSLVPGYRTGRLAGWLLAGWEAGRLPFDLPKGEVAISFIKRTKKNNDIGPPGAS